MTDSTQISRPELFRHFATASGTSAVKAVAALGGGEGDRYAAFFRDLDSYTQYWQFYRPELRGLYMNLVVQILFPGPIAAWETFVSKEKTAEAPAALTALNNAIAKPDASDALRQIDGLLTKLLGVHFPGPSAGTLDTTAYLTAIEAFARDRLPVDQDRLARVQSGGDDVSHHRMDDPSMWFKWAAAVDCAAMLEGATGMTSPRTAYLGAAAFGSAMDCVFRARGKTRPEYHPDSATETLLRGQAASWVRDGDAARAQARELFRVFIS